MSAPRLLSSSDVGDANRSRVMRTLYRHGPMSRAAMADLLNVSRATITSIVSPLISSGRLREMPQVSAPSSGGKPPKPLWFSESLIGAAYLSEGGIDLALVSAEGRILDRITEAIDVGPASSVEGLRQHFNRMFADRKLLGIGVGVAGTVNTEEGRSLVSHRTPVATNLALGPLLTAWYSVPALVDHHPRVQSIGDLWFGLGRELDTFGSLYAGDVIGLGVVRNGAVERGRQGAGGEVGHMVVAMEGDRCECGRAGCWETVASASWLRQRALTFIPEDPTVAGVAELATHGVGPAQELLSIYAGRLGLGLANLEQILGLGTYIIHGQAIDGGDPLRRALLASLEAGAPKRDHKLQVLLADTPDDMTILGAAGLMLSSEYAPYV